MSEKHTPGLWRAKRDVANRRHWTIWSDSGDIGAAIAKTANWLDTDDEEEEAANARLIAAAPALLDACEWALKVLNLFSYHIQTKDVRNSLEAAIELAKKEGGL